MSSILKGQSNVFYHGTTSNHIDSIMSGIDLSICTNKADFGRGLYLTPDLDTSLRWANKRARHHNKYSMNNFVEGFVFTFDVNPSILELNGHIFDYSGFSWVKFIHK